MSKKILIIEDEEVLLGLLQRKLTGEGFDISIAKNGRTGLEAMKKERPDLILLDIMMPEKDGFEVLEDMQKDKKLNNIPVIIISNSGQPVELDRARALGVRDWLIKTEFNPQEVLEKVQKQFAE